MKTWILQLTQEIQLTSKMNSKLVMKGNSIKLKILQMCSLCQKICDLMTFHIQKSKSYRNKAAPKIKIQSFRRFEEVLQKLLIVLVFEPQPKEHSKQQIFSDRRFKEKCKSLQGIQEQLEYAE
eukprot:403341653